MLILCWVLAILYFAVGIITVVSPETARRGASWFSTPVRVRGYAVVGFILGLVLWFGRSYTHWSRFAGFFAIISLLASLIYLVLPWNLVARVDDLSIHASDSRYRIYGIITILVGVAFLRAATGVF